MKMQGEAACQAGEPSRQSEDPSPEGVGGYQLLTQPTVENGIRFLPRTITQGCMPLDQRLHPVRQGYIRFSCSRVESHSVDAVGHDRNPRRQSIDGRLPPKLCRFSRPGTVRAAAASTALGRIGGKMAELLMNSATARLTQRCADHDQLCRPRHPDLKDDWNVVHGLGLGQGANCDSGKPNSIWNHYALRLRVR